jgi:hypothetical protein
MAHPARNATPANILNPSRIFFATTRTGMDRRLLQVERNANLLIEVQSPPPPDAERVPGLREILARQARLQTAPARRASGRSRRPARRRASQDPGLLPELSEIEIIRHFTRLSTWNYAIDLGMYPLGSCTMKYNPRVNELVARIEGLAEAHPYRPESLAQGILEVIDLLQRCLIEITGMDTITLQPAAGAHGEFTGILLVRAWHESQGNPRKKILIPDSAHGTNPATAAICGYRSKTSSPTPKAASTSKPSPARWTKKPPR